MRIYKFSNILAIPFVIALVFFIYLLIQDTHDLRVAYAIIPLTLLVLIYLFQPQIDFWWLSRKPIPLEESMVKLLERTNTFYRTLPPEQKAEFDKHLILYINGRSFMAKGMESDNTPPYDVQIMIAQIPTTLNFSSQDYLFKPYERIILYKHAFPSPIHKFLHTFEIHEEDGVVIVSLEHAEAAFFNPQQFYNVAWHAFAQAYILKHNWRPLDANDENVWRAIAQNTSFTKDYISKTLGFEEVDLSAVLITLYFTVGQMLESILPELHKTIQKRFS